MLRFGQEGGGRVEGGGIGEAWKVEVAALRDKHNEGGYCAAEYWQEEAVLHEIADALLTRT